MLSAVVLSQYTVSSSRVAITSAHLEHRRRRRGWGGGVGGRKKASMWSAVCCATPHLKFAEGTKPHLCIVERNSPTPGRKRDNDSVTLFRRSSVGVIFARTKRLCIFAHCVIQAGFNYTCCSLYNSSCIICMVTLHCVAPIL